MCLGLGDASASIVGYRFGNHKWPDPKKSLEGTGAFVGAVSVGLIIVKHSLDDYSQLSFLGIATVATATALLEASTAMNDNVIVPLYMMSILQTVR